MSVRLAQAAVLCLLVAVGPSLALSETLEAFGSIRIERGPSERSYLLRVSTPVADGGEIALRCIADEQALIVRVHAPGGSRFAAHQTITVWSDKAPAADIVVSGDPSGVFGTLAMNEAAGLEPDAAFMALFETIVTAEEHVSYSVEGRSVRLDATQLQAARARFAELCARRSD